MAGQSVMDRVIAARHSIAGQGLAKSVCKATTEEVIGPKKKHLDYLLQCTNEPNVSIPQMADLLIERTQHANWVVVFKSLISINNLMNYGNERFTQYLASNNCSFNLSGFVDKGGVQGYDMSTYIRRYAKYLNEKAVSYRSMAFDFCKVKRGKEDGLLRTMNTEKLLKTLPVLQQQLDALLEFDCTPNELTNGVITACFMLLFKDLIRLFACYNDGIINLLEKYFDMNKKQCKDALDLYKKFLVRMDKVSEFLKVAENMGIDKGDIPDLAKDGDKSFSSMIIKAPASLLDALEQHLASLEGKKVGTATTPTGTSKPASFTTALNSMSTNAFDVSEAEKKRILDEENQQLQKLKDQKLKDTSPHKSPAAANNPFASTSPAATPNNAGAQPNLFGSPADSAKPSDDLMALAGNPFMGNVQDAMTSAYTQPQHQAPASNPFGTASFQTNGYASNPSGFTSEADFAKAFSNGGTNSQASFGLSPIMTPSNASTQPPGFDAFGDVMTPANKLSPQTQASQHSKPLGGDLDSSLASLASNLNVSGGVGQMKKDHQWQPKGENKLTGGNAFQRQPIAQSTTATNPTGGWGQPGFQQPPNMMGAPGAPMMYGQPMAGAPMGQPMMGMAQPMAMGMQPGMAPMPMQQPGMYGMQRMQPMGPSFTPQPAQPAQGAPPNNVNDPFGAL